MQGLMSHKEQIIQLLCESKNHKSLHRGHGFVKCILKEY